MSAKKFCKYLLFRAGALIAGALFLYFDKAEILLQSLESKTTDSSPVFNKIKFFPGLSRDIWMMNQSHHGIKALSKDWDRLAIVVDKNKKTTQFLQLSPGELQWDDDLINQTKTFRVSCFICHSNGPRAIRPDLNGVEISFLDRARIFSWNFRIKTYGRLNEHPDHKLHDENLQIPFRHRAQIDNEILNVKTCMKCHNENGFLSRGFLTRQNVMAIRFMLENEFMPPIGFHLEEKDKKQIQMFISGF